MTTSTFAENTRSIDNLDDDELRTSLKVAGWNKQLPSIYDENGVVLVGHRRLKIAAEEGIEPVIKVVRFGTGPEADAERMRLAVVSNIGAAPLTKKDRKRLAVRMYGDGSGLTMEAIAGMLGVVHSTIVKDLAEIVPAEQIKSRPKTATNPKGAGRDKGTRPDPIAKAECRTPEPQPTPEPDLVENAMRLVAKMSREEKVILRDRVARDLANGAGATTDEFDLNAAPKTWRQKFEVAERRMQREFNDRVEERVWERFVVVKQEWIDWYKNVVEEARKRSTSTTASCRARCSCRSSSVFTLIARTLSPTRNSVMHSSPLRRRSMCWLSVRRQCPPSPLAFLVTVRS